MYLKKIELLLCVVILLLANVNLGWADEVEPDKFRFSIGSFALLNYESHVSLTDPDLGAGISISPEDTLGLDFETTVLRIEGYYRFHPEHALTYSWYSIGSTGTRRLDRDIDWVSPEGDPITIPFGAQVTSKLDYDIFKLGYLWSFHHTDKVELGVGAGLHITQFSMELDSSITNPPQQSLERVETTVPLPVLSLVLNYRVTPKFHWFLKTEAFLMKFDNWTGSYRDATLGMEYRFWKHVALGVGLSSSSLDIEEEDPDQLFKFDNSTNGALLYLSTYY